MGLTVCKLVAVVVLVREDVLIPGHLVHQSLYVTESYGAVSFPTLKLRLQTDRSLAGTVIDAEIGKRVGLVSRGWSQSICGVGVVLLEFEELPDAWVEEELYIIKDLIV